MQNDTRTLQDLSIFPSEDGGSIFELINRCETQNGSAALRRLIHSPPQTLNDLLELQEVIQFLVKTEWHWPEIISNGTVVMIEKYFEEADQGIYDPRGFALNGMIQKLFNRNQFFYTQFSITHLADALRGVLQLLATAENFELPALLKKKLEQLQQLVQHPLTGDIIATDSKTSYAVLAKLNHRARREMKPNFYQLLQHLAQLDAWFCMAKVTKEYHWVFPELLPALPTVLEFKSFRHPLLPAAVPYNIDLKQGENFLILTGANMSGKTTFLRALGINTLLAHLGMGVPASSARLSFMQGIITNMHVEDNLIKGESYFLAEVKRMKNTAEKIVEPEPCLIMMDELFKGTNVHDAYECTKAIVEGLLLHQHHIMILSTHLHEVAHVFEGHTDLQFAFFTTNLTEDGQYHFAYQLEKGISKDRIGYRILKNEGVLDLLKKKMYDRNLLQDDEPANT